jgi:hypothetical protein
MQPTNDRPVRSGGSRWVRYVPFVAIVVVIAVIAVALGGGGGDDDENANDGGSGNGTGELPLTFDEAAEQGLDVDFGPGCDTTTGQVKVEYVYAAPCVEPFEGDNGGATSPGVTTDEITVVVYNADPALDPLQAAFFRGAGADVDPDANRTGFEGYLRLFEQYYELYGRKLRIESYRGTGTPDDEVKAKADAIAIADEYHPFAVINGPTQSSAFADELAARKILCVGICSLAFPEQFTADRDPYLWSNSPSPDQANIHAAELIGTQLAGRKAEFAGDASFQDQERSFGFVHYDNPDGRYKPGFEAYVDLLRDEYDVEPAVDLPFFLDLARAGENARTTIAALKDAGVTTVVFSGDPITPSYLTKEATAQDYFPEWVITTTVLADAAIFGRTYDQEQWEHAFGLALNPVRGVQATQDGYNLWQWQYCEEPPANIYGVLLPGPSLLMVGISLAGPDLTPQTFRAGLFRSGIRGGGAMHPRYSQGKHGVWPGTDLYGFDDAGILWWDPEAEGPDETGSMGKGLYRYTKMGKRYLPKDWPSEQVELFDGANTVTIFDELPPEDRTPDYPSPCAR